MQLKCSYLDKNAAGKITKRAVFVCSSYIPYDAILVEVEKERNKKEILNRTN